MHSYSKTINNHSVIILLSLIKKIITVLIKIKSISRESIQKLDLLLLILETIDLNGIQSFHTLSNKLNLQDILPNKVIIWKLRNNNPMRKSYIKNNIKLEEFDALIKITVEMSRYLYPYIRNILQSREDLENNPAIWNDFKKRFVDLINERFNIDSMRVKKLLNFNKNDESIVKFLLTLALCNSDNGYQKLRSSLLDF